MKLKIKRGFNLILFLLLVCSLNVFGAYTTYDDFNDNSINENKWDAHIDSSGVLIEEGNAYAKATVTDTFSSAYFYTTDNMKNKDIRLKVKSATGPTGANVCVGFSETVPSSHANGQFPERFSCDGSDDGWGSGDILEFKWVNDNTIEMYSNGILVKETVTPFTDMNGEKWYFSFGTSAGDIGIGRELQVDYIEIEEYKDASCKTHSSKVCDRGDVYWYDSCGNKEDLYQDCTNKETCSNGVCVSSYPDNRIWWGLVIFSVLFVIFLIGRNLKK